MSLDVDATFLLAYVISDNDRRVFDLEETARTLCYRPQDNAESFFQK